MKNTITIEIFESNRGLRGSDFLRIVETDGNNRNKTFLGGIMTGEKNKMVTDLENISESDLAELDNTTHKASFYCTKDELTELLNHLLKTN